MKEFTYTIVSFDPPTGALQVWVRTDAHPLGEKYVIPTLKDDGTYCTEAEIHQRIEAAIPVSWFDTLEARAAKNPSFEHIARLLGKDHRCRRDAKGQGVLKPTVL